MPVKTKILHRGVCTLGLSLLMLTACGKDNDSWVQVPAMAMNGQLVSSSNMLSVDDGHRNDALTLLNKKPIVEMTPQQALEFTGQKTRGEDTLKPFLVRAVSFAHDSGSYNALYDGKSIYIYYMTMGNGWHQSQHSALVLYLPQKPVVAYASATATK